MDGKTPERHVALRKRGEKLLKQEAGRLQERRETDFYKLVHELGTHQIELEMQN
jgi:hypothetical protein